jgi:hypothetical protein
MIYVILITSFLVGYFSHVSQLFIQRKFIKNEIDMLLDEIESCGEIINIKLLYNDRRCIEMKSGNIITEGSKNYHNNNWNNHPVLIVNNEKVKLNRKQQNRIHSLVNKKHAESGRQQITEGLTK